MITIWGSFDIRSNYFVKTYCKGKTVGKTIAITFDDGPTPITKEVLNVLRKYNVKATFFCIGTQIEEHQDIFNAIFEEGHLIGNHSYSHDKKIGFFSTKKVVSEIQKNDLVIEKYLGKKTLLFRPPFGVTNPRFERAIKQTKHFVIGWNNRSLDTIMDDENKILKRISKKIMPGGIILLHDTSAKTVRVLEQLLLFLKTENYTVTPLDELLKIKAYEN
ncbi:polysaccharide deacetylase family protein [Flavobacterium aciduliphilum]|nr:polysaccharide deacetylase family protein [Flavobacterium aciduliphilum]